MPIGGFVGPRLAQLVKEAGNKKPNPRAESASGRGGGCKNVTRNCNNYTVRITRRPLGIARLEIRVSPTTDLLQECPQPLTQIGIVPTVCQRPIHDRDYPGLQQRLPL